MPNQLMTFPVNQARRGIFKNHCMWAVLDISQDSEEFRRILKQHEVRKVQTMIETVQAQLNNLLFRDSQVLGMHLVPGKCDRLNETNRKINECDDTCIHSSSSWRKIKNISVQ